MTSASRPRSSAVAPAELRRGSRCAGSRSPRRRVHRRTSAVGLDRVARRAGRPARWASSSVIVPPLPGAHHVLDDGDDRRVARAAVAAASRRHRRVALFAVGCLVPQLERRGAQGRGIRRVPCATCARCDASRAPARRGTAWRTSCTPAAPARSAGSAAARSAAADRRRRARSRSHRSRLLARRQRVVAVGAARHDPAAGDRRRLEVRDAGASRRRARVVPGIQTSSPQLRSSAVPASSTSAPSARERREHAGRRARVGAAQDLEQVVARRRRPRRSCSPRASARRSRR